MKTQKTYDPACVEDVLGSVDIVIENWESGDLAAAVNNLQDSAACCRESAKRSKVKPGVAADDRTRAIRKHAQQTMQREGDLQLEIDDDAIVSEGDDNGAYVQAWVWVRFAETPWDKETEAV